MSGSEIKSAHTELILSPSKNEAGANTITIEYFALFRGLAKKSEETLEFENASGFASIPALYDSLRERYRFPLERASVHVAVNDAYVPWDYVLKSGDRVVFIPPVSGG